MKARMNVVTEYAPHGLTSQGTWRPITASRFRSQAPAEQIIEEHKKACANHPRVFESCKEYKIMKRTVVTAIGEWEDV